MTATPDERLTELYCDDVMPQLTGYPLCHCAGTGLNSFDREALWDTVLYYFGLLEDSALHIAQLDNHPMP